MEIKSDMSAASQHATALANSLSSLMLDATTKDEVSYLQGNDRAKEVLDKSDLVASNFSGKLTTFVGLVQDTASDFQVMDQQLSAEIKASESEK